MIENSWKVIFENEFNFQYFKNLSVFIKSEYKKYKIFPVASSIFSAFNICSFDNLKVVILGQDPYPGENQANGLCFSVNKGVEIPKSLKNIFREIKNDVGFVDDTNGDLSRWARQGVLLLNTVLTVRANAPGSHFNYGWETFTDNILKTISKIKKNVVYILWGNKAKQKIKLLDTDNNLILTSAHPSPLSAHNGFFGNHHFSKANEYLKKNNLIMIDWS